MNSSEFQIGFSYQGTADSTSYTSMEAALEYRSSLGDAAIMAYIHNLAVKGGALLAKRWKTEVLHPDKLVGALVDVR